MCPWYGWSESGEYLPAQETVLCDPCRRVFLFDDAVKMLRSTRGLQYSRLPQEMFRSALDGCHLCRQLLCMPYDYRWTEDGKKIEARSSRRWPLDLWIAKAESNKTHPASYIRHSLLRRCLFHFSFRGDIRNQHYITVYSGRVIVSRPKLILEISATHDDPAALFVQNRPVNKDLTCEVTYKMVRDWLATCHTQHEACRTNYQPTDIRPTFVLDVSPPLSAEESDRIKLHRLTDQEITYAALSYCWGGPQINATTNSRLTLYMKSIQMLWLPQTIQDAIIVTRKLGLQYLWVDSLCIIQDAEEEMMAEIGKMEHIYTNAHVTISAASSPNCQQGFLNPSPIPKCSVEIPFSVGGEEVGNVVLTPIQGITEESYHYDPSTPEPINSRAWAFQETFLSCRRLIYSQYQLFWVCPAVWGRDGGRMSRSEYFSGLELTRQLLPSPTYEDWLNVIHVYSKKELSDPLDKLSALSSIAAYFYRHLQSRYLAGLWDGGFKYDRLIHGLCWYGGNYSMHNHQVVRSPVWRAPSWSFLSMDGPIGFKRQDDLNLSPRKYGTAFGCTDIKCGVVPFSAEAAFGRVRSGTLQLNGRIIECNIAVSSKPFLAHHGWKFNVVSPSSDRFIGHLLLDTLEPDVTDPSRSTVSTHHGTWHLQQTVWCVMLRTERHISQRLPSGGSVGVKGLYETEWQPLGLGLVKLQDGSFHRIGLFQGTAEAFSVFRKQEPQLITII